MLVLSSITQNQWRKIGKALVYSFCSGFTGTIVLMATDFIQAAKDGNAAIEKLAVALLVAATVGGINAVLVTIKMLFTEDKEEQTNG